MEVPAALQRFLDFGAGAFGLALVRCDGPTDREALAAALRAALPAVVRHPYSALADDPLHFATHHRPSAAVIITGLEGTPRGSLGRLNVQRDLLQRTWPVPWVIVGHQEALRQLHDEAPDFCDFASARLDIAPSLPAGPPTSMIPVPGRAGLLGSSWPRTALDPVPLPASVEAALRGGDAGATLATWRAAHPDGADPRPVIHAALDRGQFHLARSIVEAWRLALARDTAAPTINHAALAEATAEVLGASGDIRGALRWANEAVELRQAAHGDSDLDTILAHWTLGAALQAAGDFAAANATLHRVLVAIERALGPDHPGTWSALHNLAVTLDAQGDPAGAKSLYETVLAAKTRLLGSEHPDTLSTQWGLAGALFAQGDLAGARRLFEQALEATTRLLGAEHPDTLLTLQNLAGTLHAQGDLTGARRLFEHALKGMTRQLGPAHPTTLHATHSLAGTLHAQGDLVGARGCYEQALEARVRQLGAEHPDTLSTIQNLAGTLHAQGDLMGARRLFEQALEARTRLLGAEHPDTLRSLQNLAATLAAQGELDAAQEMQQRLLPALQRVLGPDHSKVRGAIADLATMTSVVRDDAPPPAVGLGSRD